MDIASYPKRGYGDKGDMLPQLNLPLEFLVVTGAEPKMNREQLDRILY